MPACANISPVRIDRPRAFSSYYRLLAWLGLALGLSTLAVGCHSSPLLSVQARFHNEHHWTLMDARVQHDFPAAVLEALEHGVRLPLNLRILVRRVGSRFWEPVLADRNYRYEVHYQVLSGLYNVSRPTVPQRTFVTLDGALEALGDLPNLPVLPDNVWRPGERYWVKVQVELDLDHLPLPLRPIAYISSDWRLDSGWQTWRFE